MELVPGRAAPGRWVVASVHLVADARLSAAQLVVVGVGQAVIALVFEVPAGGGGPPRGRSRCADRP
ncbi:hypothetical protein DMB66_48965 [Actinoplanes sp. ATCC 53533]|uniref:hypothetical protein n=1 Tax=Actinoplanes sp. ATCC 53533 TaxID=1288362 RepID=UPI000F79D410|nr:hypothetical protein [Actinoplanes sp. ATCC 53533]RSM46856.1 hypothetical protein DMB66_48965 [Actinoplanes sp. ATCC 53533]